MKKTVGLISFLGFLSLALMSGVTYAEDASSTSVKPSGAAVGELKHLTELLTDGQEGYKLAADGARTLELKKLFSDAAVQRARFLNDMRAEVSRLGGDPFEGGTVLGPLERGWINIRTALSRNDDKVLVDEVLRSENITLKGYQDALDKDLPHDTRKKVEKQRNDIQKTFDKVKAIDLKQK